MRGTRTTEFVSTNPDKKKNMPVTELTAPESTRTHMTNGSTPLIHLDGVTKVFLTHLHSDHVVALPELYLEPWAVAGRFMCEVRKGHGR